MTQPHGKPPRGLKTPNVPRPTHVAASVQQAIQRDPLQAMPGEEAAQRKHPVMHAIDLLINYDVDEGWEDREDEQDAYREAGRQLQAYHAEQMAGLQQASGRAEESTRQLAEFIEDVAEMLDFDLTDRSAGEMLDVLRDRLNPPEPFKEVPPVTPNEHAALKNMHAVCSVLAKHYGDDPAVTFANAAGLVQDIISGYEYAQETAKQQIVEADTLRRELQKRGGTTAPTPEEADAQAYEQTQLERMAALYATDDERQAAQEKGWHSRALLQQILVRLTQNQLPEGWREHSKTLIDSNARYEAALATMRNVLTLL